MPVDDGLAAPEARREPRLAPGQRAWLVHDSDSGTAGLDHALRGQCVPQRRLVHVSVHRLDRPERPELLEHARRDEVARVEDQVRLAQEAKALLGEPPGAAGTMRV